MKKVLRNVTFIMSAIMILLAAKNGIAMAVDRITLSIYEVAKGLTLDCIPLGSAYYCGTFGTIIGYFELIILLGCVSVMVACLIMIAALFVKAEIEIFQKHLHTQLKKRETHIQNRTKE